MVNSKTFSFTGSVQTWTVPDGVNAVGIKSWGGKGADAGANGGDGGYAEGTLSVSPGDTLNLYVGGSGEVNNGNTYDSGGWPNGGDGGYGDAGSFTTGEAGGGGGSSHVIYNGERVIVAGGGGGGGDAESDHNPVETATSGGADGGGAGRNASDVSAGSRGHADGGHGGSQSGENGGNGPGSGSAYDDNDYHVAAAGGGGGGGWNGGDNGGRDVSNGDSAVGAGGGGGDGYVGGVSNATMSVGANSGDGEIVIEWDEQPATPGSFTATTNDDATVSLSWGSVTYGDYYEVYHARSSGVSDSDENTRSPTTASTTDSITSSGEHYYKVRAVHDGTYGPVTSGLSTEVSVKLGVIQEFDGTNWNYKTAQYMDSNSTSQQSSSLRVYDGSSWVEK